MTEALPIWRGFRRFRVWPRLHAFSSLCSATAASHDLTLPDIGSGVVERAAPGLVA